MNFMKAVVRVRRIALPTIFVLAAGAASAANISIFNTGVDGSGNVVAHNMIGDMHYSLITVPSGPTQTRAITSAGGFPVGPWIGDNSLSRWIGPNSGEDLNGPAGTYIYRTTFDLTGLSAASAQLSGRWSADNPGLDIMINGVSTGEDTDGDVRAFERWFDFNISSGFVGGINTLDFIVRNDGGPTGLRVEVAGTADVPVPAALPLLVAALGGLGVAARRRKKA